MTESAGRQASSQSSTSSQSASGTADAPRQRSAAEIRADIEQGRQELGRSVEHLRDRVNELTDWRSQLQQHQQELAIGAAVVGFAIGAAILIRRRG